MHMSTNVKREIEKIAELGFLGEAREVKYEIKLSGELNEDLIKEISRIRKEPEWMLKIRLMGLKWFKRLPMPKWVAGVDQIDLDKLALYTKSSGATTNDWSQVPDDIKRYYELLKIPEQEARVLAGVDAVYGSESVYNNLKEDLEKKGVILLPTSEAVKKYPELVKKYFGKIFPPTDHKFAALHTALWSTGAFVYVPPGVKIAQPLEALFLIGSPLEGQFEHTLIVADEGSYLNFIEACAAPTYRGYSFHDGMVEIYAHRNSTIKFTTIQNWSKNVINFGNKRAILEEGARVDWVVGSLGSRLSYEYPMSVLKGRNSSSQAILITIANGPYIKDGGAKMVHVAPNTRSRIISKSVSNKGGTSVYRGLIKVLKGAKRSIAHGECESLILDDKSKSYTYPHNQVDEKSSNVTHEATAGRLGEDQLFYLKSRGFTENEAKSLVVMGFLDNIIVQLPFEYASVLRSVIQVEFSKIGGAG